MKKKKKKRIKKFMKLYRYSKNQYYKIKVNKLLKLFLTKNLNNEL